MGLGGVGWSGVGLGGVGWAGVGWGGVEVTYPSSLHLGSEHDHHRGALLPGHLPEVCAGVGQRALAGDVAVNQAGGRDLHLRGAEPGVRRTARCVCVCVCVCVRTCVYKSVCVCVCVSVSVCVYKSVCVCVCVCTYVCVCMYERTCEYVCVRMYVRVSMYERMCVCEYVCV